MIAVIQASVKRGSAADGVQPGGDGLQVGCVAGQRHLSQRRPGVRGSGAPVLPALVVPEAAAVVAVVVELLPAVVDVVERGRRCVG